MRGGRRKIKILCDAFSHWTCAEAEILLQHDSNLKRGRKGGRVGSLIYLLPAFRSHLECRMGVTKKKKKKTQIKSNQSDCGTAINWWDNNDGSLPTVPQLQLTTPQRQTAKKTGRGGVRLRRSEGRRREQEVMETCTDSTLRSQLWFQNMRSLLSGASLALAPDATATERRRKRHRADWGGCTHSCVGGAVGVAHVGRLMVKLLLMLRQVLLQTPGAAAASHDRSRLQGEIER